MVDFAQPRSSSVAGASFFGARTARLIVFEIGRPDSRRSFCALAFMNHGRAGQNDAQYVEFLRKKSDKVVIFARFNGRISPKLIISSRHVLELRAYLPI